MIVEEEQSIAVQRVVIQVMSIAAGQLRKPKLNRNLRSSYLACMFQMTPLPAIQRRILSVVSRRLRGKRRPLFPSQEAASRSNRLHSQIAISDPPQSANPGSSAAVMVA
jgi:hypothetical protein